MRAAKLSAGLLAAGGIMGYLGAGWQSRSWLIAAGVVLLTGVIVAAFTELDYR